MSKRKPKEKKAKGDSKQEAKLSNNQLQKIEQQIKEAEERKTLLEAQLADFNKKK